ncbi:actin cortical patch SUR7/pH-response regulator pali [Biscogniauxia mediterranea]|nr:actin cortical patch SUR7/pH-response regulator pali [Biscogniauxia mediterranea]
MARTGFFHHIGTFLLFAAVVLLIVADISAPVVADISLLRVELGDSSSSSSSSSDQQQQQTVITFGTFGWCARDVSSSSSSDDDDDSSTHCTRATVGYDPISALEEYTSISAGDAATASARALTRVMVLHPVGTGLAFLSFLLAAGAGFVGSLLGALGALLSFAVVLVALVCDFVGLAVVRSAVNNYSGEDNDNGGDNGVSVSARWGSAIWTVLAAAVCCLLAAVVLFFTCCSARMHRRREARGVGKY